VFLDYLNHNSLAISCEYDRLVRNKLSEENGLFQGLLVVIKYMTEILNEKGSFKVEIAGNFQTKKCSVAQTIFYDSPDLYMCLTTAGSHFIHFDIRFGSKRTRSLNFNVYMKELEKYDDANEAVYKLLYGTESIFKGIVML